MPVLYSPEVKAQRMQAVVDACDVAPAPAVLEICSANYGEVLAVITLEKPSFIRTGDVITIAGLPRSDVSADATGVAVLARIKNGDGVVVISGLTCGMVGDITMNSTNLQAGQPVVIHAATFTHA
jgi:hypothetical protein